MRAYWIQGQSKEGHKPGVAIDAAELSGAGIHYEALPLDGYQPRLDALRTEHSYHHQDQVALTPGTEGLDVALAKFDDEHLHSEDEVRFVLEGEGIFDIRSPDDRWMRVIVEAGDLIIVPKERYHRFELTEQKTIRCVRLFQDASGWVPTYRDAPV